MPDPNVSGAAAPKVVVLGRAGDAQQQLKQALDAIGVQTLAAGDLDQLDPELMRTAHPDVFLVSIDERTKDTSLARWQALFDAPGTTVVFDDADVTSRLSGWDLARWARHLASKVLGKPNDVLPPVQADAERLPHSPSLDEAILDFDHGNEIVNKDIGATAEESPGLSIGELSIDELTFDAGEKGIGAPAEESPGMTIGELIIDTGETDFAALSSQFEAEQQRAASEDRHSDAAPTLDELLAHDSSSLPDIDLDFSSPPVEATASAKPAPASAPPADLSSLELTPFDTTYAPVKAAAPKEPAVDMDLSAYALEPLHDESADVEAASPAPAPAPAPAKASEPAGKAKPAPAKAQATATAPSAGFATAPGVVAIVAGLGGPDAVRQVLAGLPKTLPVPVLLWQHLDAGKHDRLAQQLAKASALPVYLANPGDLARSGAVAVMAASVGVAHDAEGWRFNVADGGLAPALQSALGEPSSMVMVLSGADGSVVDIVAAHATRGSEARVQTPDSCFDGAAASALSGRGVTAASPVELAAAVASHWPA
jgi:chemosensory pili system protein ChpB (putative protein-glutamate methylesterase)